MTLVLAGGTPQLLLLYMLYKSERNQCIPTSELPDLLYAHHEGGVIAIIVSSRLPSERQTSNP